MPLYFFSVPNGNYSGSADCGGEFADRDAAWKELTGVCGDMVGGISRGLRENGEWRIELLDASKRPVFRIRLVAETLDQATPVDPAPEPAGT
jgi:hypothetical protein